MERGCWSGLGNTLVPVVETCTYTKHSTERTCLGIGRFFDFISFRVQTCFAIVLFQSSSVRETDKDVPSCKSQIFSNIRQN